MIQKNLPYILLALGAAIILYMNYNNNTGCCNHDHGAHDQSHHRHNHAHHDHKHEPSCAKAPADKHEHDNNQ